MNILVTGVSGQLGSEIQLVSKQSKDHYIFTDVCEGYTKLDITNLEDIRKMVQGNKIERIISRAAWTNVDKAETAGEIVELLNATASENLAKAAKEIDGLLVHVSIDYVFGGDPYNTPCKKDMKGIPTGVYGPAKLYGEEKTQATGANRIILRTTWLYSEFGHNFAKTMMNLTATKPQLKVVFGQCEIPTYTGDLADAIFDIVENHKYEGNSGIYYFSNEGVCSWYDFAIKTAEPAGNTACDIQPCHSDEFPSPTTRPAYSILDRTKVKETFGIKISYWVDSLKKCIKGLQEQGK